MGNPTPRSVLLLSTDSGFTLPALRQLGRAGYRVFLGTHESKGGYASKSRWLDGTTILPENVFTNGVKSVSILQDLVGNNAIDLIFPLTLDAISWCISHRDHIEQWARLIPLPQATMFEVANNRARWITWCEDHGYPTTPHRTIYQSSDLDTVGDLGFPLVVKDSEHNHLLIRSAEDFVAQKEPLLLRRRPFVVESFFPGRDIDANIVASNGRIIDFGLQENDKDPWRLSGEPVALRRVEDEAISTTLERLIADLHWSGVAHIDMRRNQASGEWVIFELNPRLWRSQLFAEKVAGMQTVRRLVELGVGITRARGQKKKNVGTSRWYVFPQRGVRDFGWNAFWRWKEDGISLMPTSVGQDWLDFRPIISRLLSWILSQK